LTLLSVFFAFGALMASLAAVGLVFPDGALEPMWRLNRHAQVGLMELRGWGIALMLGVAIACAFAAVGVWRRARWGHRLAVILLAINLLSDVLNAVLLSDLRTLIGVPIGGAIIYYLLRSPIRAQFGTRAESRAKSHNDSSGTGQ
jgi:uncharacterized membrane protein (DUF2068 family)